MPRNFWRKVAELFWPSQGFRRSIHYLGHRVKRLPATPHAIAAGFASGAAVSFFPAIGFHFLLGFGLAWLVRGNMLASALGTAVGNPLTFPIIFSTAYSIGRAFLDFMQVPTPVEETFDVVAEGEALIAEGDLLEGGFWEILPLIKVTAIGSIPLAILAFVLFYALIYKLTARFQEARRHRRLRPRGFARA
jgi:uncharacterized protein (DUF2062 family)